ncbi:MAG: hypothetical protein Q9227_007779 [Pyrenula ochraceoflavens]
MDHSGSCSNTKLDIQRRSKPPDTADNSTDISETLQRLSLGTPTATPLPPSSPVGSPQKTPKTLRNIGPSGDTLPSSPSRKNASPRSSNPERRSSTPLLQNKRSTSSLHRAEVPLRRISSTRYASSPITSTSPELPRPSSQTELQIKPMITSASIAQAHFRKELELHRSGNLPSETAVILHDSCYGHRYSRPRTSKAQLNTIVERPERIHASILGVSAAYIRLGGRHADGVCPIAPEIDLRDMPHPPFHMRKSTRAIPLASSAVTQVHGQKWMEELKVMCESAEGKLALNGKELVRPVGYTQQEDGSPSPKLHEGDLYLCRDSLDALEGCLGGVFDGIDTVFGPGATKRAFVCVRPPGHHCSSSYPSGFCWLNNVHVGISHAAMNHGLTHAAIIDFDLHHGDGSQAITWEHNKKAAAMPRNTSYHKRLPIGYYSIHDINSYPCEMGDEEKVKNASLCIENAHGQSIWNVHLEAWKDQADFWRLYESRYRVLLDKARNFLRGTTAKLLASLNSPQPKAAIFISAGFDASEWEGQGMQRHKVNVPTEFYAKFTRDIISLAEEENLGVDGRVISVLEGGYSDRALTSGAFSHICGLAQRTESTVQNISRPQSSLTADLTKSNRPFQVHKRQPLIDGQNHPATSSYEPEWWDLPNLEALEQMVHPPSQSVGARKPKDKTPGNYSSPTQSSTAKMVDPSKARRYSSLSAMELCRLSSEPEPPQPLPEVDWATASFELSRLLIPTDRQTASCRHDELNAEATRARRERQSVIGLPSTVPPAEGRMQLRDRKLKPSIIEEEPIRTKSRADRRRTIAAASDLPDPDAQAARNLKEVEIPSSRPVSRRLSAASSVLSGLSSLNLEDRQDSEMHQFPRPTPAERTARAPSVMSERGPKAPVVKKTRTGLTTKSTTTRNGRISPKKATGNSIDRPPPSGVQQPMLNGATTDKDRISSGETLTSSTEPTKTGDVNDIASSLKKIKLKVPTPEENAARESKVRESKQAKEKKPRAPRRPAVSKATNKAGNVQMDKNQIVKPSTFKPTNPDTSEPVGKLETGTENTQTQADLHKPIPAAQVTNLSPEPVQSDFVPQGADVLTAQAPTQESLTISASAREKEPKPGQSLPGASIDPAEVDAATYRKESTDNLQIDAPAPPSAEGRLDSANADMETLSAPMTISSPPRSAKKTRADLPKFTSDSPIPFAKPLSSGVDLQLENQGPTAAEQKEVTLPDEGHNRRQISNVQAPPSLPTREMLSPSQAGTSSIWDVPETPQRLG